MTPDQPDSASLLQTACDVLKAEILPSLPEDKILDALMILSIMGSAIRDLEDPHGLEERQEKRLSSLMPQDAPEDDLDINAQNSTATDSRDRIADLCNAIRTGKYESGESAQKLHEILLEDVRDRLSFVNPKYLALSDADR